MEPRTKSDYATRAVEAAFSVLLELFGILGEFREYVAVVGGWVTPLIFRNAETVPVGTLDIDIAIDFARVSQDTYRTFLDTLESRDYRQHPEQPFRFFKTVTLGSDPPVEVEVDLLAGEYGGTGSGHRTQQIQDARARKARGADLVFDHYVEVSVEGRLPNGAVDRVSIKVADVVAFLVMKGMTFHGRRKDKDCYDIFYCVANYPGGIEPLAKVLKPFMENSLIAEGLAKIRSRFLSPLHVGPVAVADFLEISDPEERDIVMRDVYERVSALLDRLNIGPWES
jgi:hypothetical protein